MEKELLFGKVTASQENGSQTVLEYYIIQETVSPYTDMVTYGVKVNCINMEPGGGRSIETKQINNVFYSKADALNFMSLILHNSVTPLILHEVVEDYIVDCIHA